MRSELQLHLKFLKQLKRELKRDNGERYRYKPKQSSKKKGSRKHKK